MFREFYQPQHPFVERDVDSRQQDFEHTRRIFQQIRTALQQEQQTAQVHRTQKLFGDEVLVQHASDMNSHKFGRFAKRIRAKDLHHFDNPYYDEDDPLLKEAIKKRLGKPLTNPKLISMYKADLLFSNDLTTRVNQLSKMFLSGQISTDKVNAGLALFASSDIMLEIETSRGNIALPKPNLGNFPDRPKNATQEEVRARKLVVLKHFQELFRALPKKFKIVATGASAILEGINNVAVVSEARFEHAAHQPSDAMLEALILGFTEHTPRHIVDAFLEINSHADKYKDEDGVERDYWTPEDGFDGDKIKKVNGGFMLQHPLFQFILTCDHDGNPLSQDHFWDDRFERYCKEYEAVALGTPVRLTEMMLVLLSRIEEKVFGHSDYTMHHVDFTEEERHVMSELEKEGMFTNADWVVLPSQEAEHTTPLIQQHRDQLASSVLLFDATGAS